MQIYFNSVWRVNADFPGKKTANLKKVINESNLKGDGRRTISLKEIQRLKDDAIYHLGNRLHIIDINS